MNVFEHIKDDVVELNRNTPDRITPYYIELCVQDQKKPTTAVIQSDMINAFYHVTGISRLDIYVDKLEVKYVEEGLHDRYIQDLYLHYNSYWGGCWPLLPFILWREFFVWTYNTFIVYPYVSLRFFHNPSCLYCSVYIVFRKSMVKRI